MRHFGVALLVTALLAMLGSTRAEAGAKDGKVRWQNNRDTAGKAKVNPPLKIEANSKVELKIAFKGGQLAEFVCVGDGDCDIDVVVQDANGTIVAKDVDPAERGSDLCVCRWTPKNDEVYTITIINNDQKLYSVVTAGCN